MISAVCVSLTLSVNLLTLMSGIGTTSMLARSSALLLIHSGKPRLDRSSLPNSLVRLGPISVLQSLPYFGIESSLMWLVLSRRLPRVNQLDDENRKCSETVALIDVLLCVYVSRAKRD